MTWPFMKMATHQEALLWRAISERELVTVDHINGHTEMFGKRLGVIYPDSFFERTAPLVEAEKTVRFYFRGNMKRGGRSRKPLMGKWREHPDAVVEHSDWARDHDHRGTLDEDYFRRLASAEFGLCPHHLDWIGPSETMWTYRFIECVMVGAIPVLFRATPLSDTFADGFHWVWDDRREYTYDREAARANRALAEERFTL